MQSQEPNSDPQLQLVHHQTEQAYFKGLAGTGPYLEQQSPRECFETVMLPHYYAVMIYCCQALATPTDLSNAVNLFLEPLQSCVQSVVCGSEQQFSHDLFIPLFITGMECRGDIQRQITVEDLFLKILPSLGCGGIIPLCNSYGPFGQVGSQVISLGCNMVMRMIPMLMISFFSTGRPRGPGNLGQMIRQKYFFHIECIYHLQSRKDLHLLILSS